MGQGGGSGDRSPERVSRQNTLASPPLLHRRTSHLVGGKRSSSFDLPSVHRDTKTNTTAHAHTYRWSVRAHRWKYTTPTYTEMNVRHDGRTDEDVVGEVLLRIQEQSLN